MAFLDGVIGFLWRCVRGWLCLVLGGDSFALRFSEGGSPGFVFAVAAGDLSFDLMGGGGFASEREGAWL